MKILFSADWHIKLGQKNVPVEWARNRYLALFDKLHSIEDTCDIHIIGGDIFDKLPSMEELELYYEFISLVKIPTFIISGNHEALKKDTTFLSNLKKSTNWVNNKVIIIDDFMSIDNIDFIPYNRLKSYTPQDYDFHGNILCTHVRGEIPPHVKPEVPLELFDRWQLVLAGDLHSYSNSQHNILYPGSPLTTSFHRELVKTGVLIVDSETLEHEWIVLNLPQLLRKTILAGEDMVPSEFHHTIYEVEGDMSTLSSVENSELLDKKIVKRSSDTSLILTNDMSMQDELTDYLRYILNLDEDTVTRVLTEFKKHE